MPQAFLRRESTGMRLILDNLLVDIRLQLVSVATTSIDEQPITNIPITI
jgi:hypothetical protein